METKRHKSSSQAQLLLLEDVDGLGRKGDVVEAKPGFARNFLIPGNKALIADANSLRAQERLKAERSKQAAIDKATSEELASQITGLTLATNVKVDHEGHMYGSVAAGDIVEVLSNEGITIERKFVQLHQPIKATGLHEIQLKLKEGVTASFKLKVIPEGMDELPEEAKEVVAPLEPVEEAKTEETEYDQGEA